MADARDARVRHAYTRIRAGRLQAEEMNYGGGAQMTAGERFTREQTERRQRLARLREEKRKLLIESMPGYVKPEEPEEAISPSKRKPRDNKQNVEAPEGFGGDQEPTTRTRGAVSLDTTLDDDGPPKRSAAPGITKEEEQIDAGVASGVSGGAPPPRLSKAASILVHERISQRVEEVQGEIEELEKEVEALRASRASRRMSTAGVGGGLKRRSTASTPSKRLSSAGGLPPRISRYDSRQIGPVDMSIGAPTNVRKQAGVKIAGGGGGGFELAEGDPRFLPEAMRKKLGLLDISEPVGAKKAAGVKLGPDGKFQVGGGLTPEMMAALEEIEKVKSSKKGAR